MPDIITVNMADYKIAKAPTVLVTSGIGSCVAVCLYDRTGKIGGLAHVMLPNNTKNNEILSGRYADTGIDGLISLMRQNGANIGRLSAIIVGGGNLLASGKQPVITIGKNNIVSVKSVLANKNIRVTAENIGGSFGRALEFHTETGMVEVIIYAHPPERIILG